MATKPTMAEIQIEVNSILERELSFERFACCQDKKKHVALAECLKTTKDHLLVDLMHMVERNYKTFDLLDVSQATPLLVNARLTADAFSKVPLDDFNYHQNCFPAYLFLFPKGRIEDKVLMSLFCLFEGY